MNKVFREKGLVTRAASTLGLRRKRNLTILGAGFASVAALLVLTWTGAGKLNASIGRETRYWSAVDESWKQHRGEWNVVEAVAGGSYRYNGGQGLDLGGDGHWQLAQLCVDAAER